MTPLLLSLIFLLYFDFTLCNFNEDLVQYYDELINSTIEEAMNFVEPNDAKEYEVNSCEEIAGDQSFVLQSVDILKKFFFF